jgi:hypothetical protein
LVANDSENDKTNAEPKYCHPKIGKVTDSVHVQQVDRASKQINNPFRQERVKEEHPPA